MTNSQCKPSRIDFDAIDATEIQRILSTGDLSRLTPAEREYYSLMEMVRGLRARMMLPDRKRIVTKAGIIKLLKSDAYGLSDYMARQLYNDAINFFYTEDGVQPRAWAQLYADRAEKMADVAFSQGRLKEARPFLELAAKLRGCFDEKEAEIPDELLNQAPVIIYSASAATLGAPEADRKEVEAFIDSCADVPEVVRRRAKEDAGVLKKDLEQRMLGDIKEFSDVKD